MLQHLGPREDPVAVHDRIGAGSRPLQVGAFPLVSHAAPAAAPTIEAQRAEAPPIEAAPAPVVPIAPVTDSDLAQPRDPPGTLSGKTVSRIADGRIVESWTHWDQGAVLEGVGRIPP